MSKVLTVNSVIVADEEGQNEQFFEGHEFEDDHWALTKLGDHCFTERQEEKKQKDPSSLSVSELLKICENLGLNPASNKKADLVAAIKEAEAEADEV